MLRSALVISYSDIASDPRVRREVDWLTGDGWTVDTLGLGGHPTDDVRDHFVLGAPSPRVSGKVGTLLTHLFLPARARFRMQLLDRIPTALRERVRAGAYDLIVFNEYEFAPWVADRRDFTPAARRAKLHLDLHEYRDPRQRRKTLGGRVTGHHYRWVRDHLGHPAFTSRTVVNVPIGDMYAEEFGIPSPQPIRNIPPFVDQAPHAVDPDRIRLLFHGLPSWSRGFPEILDAMRQLPERFTMTFMLMPIPDRIARLQAEIDAHPARDRIRIVPPAPMREIAQRINEYDLEIIFYRPIEHNLEFALPNKFFEAVQGRIGLVTGESPLMAAIVREFGNGVVVTGYEGEDLASALAPLTAEDVAGFKQAADTAARVLNAEAEGALFLAAVEGRSAS